jgi:peptidoglycan/LPS O-acetylase OafA/YrhL
MQGLRALAVVLVVVHHVWTGRVSGGVDAFFVISGFLMTGQLVRAWERGELSVPRQWTRTALRIVPATAAVLLATAAATVALLPENRWFQSIGDVVASALFVENWRLAVESVNYFGPRNDASVLQHLWSLSVQMQFYLVWPALLAGLGLLLARTRRTRIRPAAALLIGGLGAASLVHAVRLTATDQPLAYFDSRARVWEFAVGGLLALVIDRLELPARARVRLGWAGVAALVSCGLVPGLSAGFPGWAALWPVLGCVAVLVAGVTGHRLGADRLLVTRPARFLGDLSFTWYLWHWPVLVMVLAVREEPVAGPLDGVLVIGLSLLAATLTRRFVEAPPLTWPRPRAARFALAGVLPVVLVTALWQAESVRKADSYAAAFDDPNHPGARALEPGFEYWGDPRPKLAPAFVALPGQWAGTGGMGCEMSPRGAGLEVCRSQVHGTPERKVLVVGDSHPTQLLAALRPIATERNWELIVMSRGGCPFSTRSEIRPNDRSCLDWNAAAADQIPEERPDFVLTMATRDVRVGNTEVTPPGFVDQWRRLDAEGIPVLAVRDNPRWSFSPSACVETHGRDADRCGAPRSALLRPRPPYLGLTDPPANVFYIDLSDSYCDPERCAPVVGNVLVYMDDNHVGSTYLTSMVPAVSRALDRAITEYHARATPP